MPQLSSAPGLSFATIADAVTAAQVGDTVLLEGGEYEESLDLGTDGLKLSAQPSTGPVIIRSHAEPVMICRGKNVVLSDLVLEACQGDCVSVRSGSLTLTSIAIKTSIGSGLVVNGSNSSSIMHACTIKGAGKYGCLISDGAVVDAKDCTIQACTAAGVVARGKGSLFSAHRCTIQNNGKFFPSLFASFCIFQGRLADLLDFRGQRCGGR